MAIGLFAFLLQSGHDGWSSAGLAQPHLDKAAPVDGSASARLSAALPVGAHTPVKLAGFLSCCFFNELVYSFELSLSVSQGQSQSLLAGCC